MSYPCLIYQAQAECSCQEGFIGESCSLSTKSNEGWGQTLLLSSGGDGGLSRRTGHGAVYHQPTDSMWVFGGESFPPPPPTLKRNIGPGHCLVYLLVRYIGCIIWFCM